MKFGSIALSIVPVRAEASDRSEMVTQLLFGELVGIEGEKNGWTAIRNLYDNYEGWVDSKQLAAIPEEEFSRLNNSTSCFVNDLVEVVQDVDTYETIPVVIGSVIRGLDQNVFSMAGRTYEYTGRHVCPTTQATVEEVLEHAMMFLNSPYLWGGKSPFGVDCSGFVQVVCMLSGVSLPRDAAEQTALGEHISFLDEARAGDLLFFDNAEGDIVHVGIYMGDQEIIHASGKVRIDRIDHQGIHNRELGKYTHQLRLIRRIL